jgi:hypothetical protein
MQVSRRKATRRRGSRQGFLDPALILLSLAGKTQSYEGLCTTYDKRPAAWVVWMDEGAEPQFRLKLPSTASCSCKHNVTFPTRSLLLPPLLSIFDSTLYANERFLFGSYGMTVRSLTEPTFGIA